MGNCTGIFNSCEGKEAGVNSGAVKKVDKDKI
jgi:hypothetical protein